MHCMIPLLLGALDVLAYCLFMFSVSPSLVHKNALWYTLNGDDNHPMVFCSCVVAWALFLSLSLSLSLYLSHTHTNTLKHKHSLHIFNSICNIIPDALHDYFFLFIHVRVLFSQHHHHHHFLLLLFLLLFPL